MNYKIVFAGLSYALLHNSLYAQSLEKVIVTTATKTEKSIEGVTASIEVIDKKQIEKIGAESLKDVLKKVGGLTLQYGTFPNASSVSKSSITIRGMSGNGTLLLLDGRRLSGEVQNPFDLDRIAASMIERIEIIKGPMSSLYGADATGGIINIITKKPTSKPITTIELKSGISSEGEGENSNINLSTQGAMDKFKYSFYVNHTNTGKYTQKENADVYAKTGAGNVKPSAHPTPGVSGISDTYTNIDVTYQEESEITTLGGRFDYDINKYNILGFDFNYLNEKRDGTYIGYFHPSKHGTGVPIYNVPVNSEDKNTRIDLGTDLTTLINDDLSFKFRIYNSYYKKRNETSAIYWQQMGYSSEEDSISDGMRANVDIMTYEAIAHYALNDQHFLTSGIEKRNETREATVFAQANEFTTKKVDYKAIYIQDEWEIQDDLNATLGMRYDQISNADNKPTFRAGLVKNFSSILNLRGNFAQGYRTPNMRELYINKQTPAGLQQGAEVLGYDLKPEFTNSVEVGFFGKNKKFNYSFTTFYNKIKDRISEVNQGSYNTFENISKATTYGTELSLGYNFSDDFTTILTWNELKTQNDETNKDLEFNPDRTFILTASYDVNPIMSTSVSGKYIGKQYYVQTLNQGASTESTQDARTNDYTLVDFNIDYDLSKDMTLFGGVNNIFDKRVDDVLGSNKGTYLFMGLRATF